MARMALAGVLSSTEPEDLKWGLSNERVEKICRGIKTDFEGVVQSTNLHKLKSTRRKKSYIVNIRSQIKEMPGHFIVLTCAKKRWQYFDPLSLPLSWLPPLQKFLRHRKFMSEEPRMPIQHIMSSRCGFFCIGFVWCMNLGLSKMDFARLFYTVNLERNDDQIVFVMNFILRQMYIQNFHGLK